MSYGVIDYGVFPSITANEEMLYSSEQEQADMD
jgi:hypothetical protein